MSSIKSWLLSVAGVMLTHATNGIRNFVIVTGEHGGEAAMRNTHTYAQAATYAKNI